MGRHKLEPRLGPLAEGTVATQFETITAAAQGCDIIVAATALQIAARSVAERMGIPYVFAAYCPAVLPSPCHAPPPLPPLPGQKPAPAAADNRELWARDHTLQPGVTARAQFIATAVRNDGAQAAAQRLLTAA